MIRKLVNKYLVFRLGYTLEELLLKLKELEDYKSLTEKLEEAYKEKIRRLEIKQ
jgi:hypothetical protein